MRAVCNTHGRDHKYLQNICLRTSTEGANWKTDAYRILLQYVISRMDRANLSLGKDKRWAILNM